MKKYLNLMFGALRFISCSDASILLWSHQRRNFSGQRQYRRLH